MAHILTSIALACSLLFAAQPQVGNDFKIIENKVEGNIRHIVAYTSESVCSQQMIIDVNVKTSTIVEARIIGGCPGNTKAITEIIKGMSVDKVISTFSGISCGSKKTSCPDQMARILKAACK